MKWSVVFEKCTTLKQFNVRNYSEIFASGFEKIKYVTSFENVDLLFKYLVFIKEFSTDSYFEFSAKLLTT